VAFLVPFVAVFLMPGAVAGATLMARELMGEETAEEEENNSEPTLTQSSVSDV
jgi:CysZ protein